MKSDTDTFFTPGSGDEDDCNNSLHDIVDHEDEPNLFQDVIRPLDLVAASEATQTETDSSSGIVFFVVINLDLRGLLLHNLTMSMMHHLKQNLMGKKMRRKKLWVFIWLIVLRCHSSSECTHNINLKCNKCSMECRDRYHFSLLTGIKQSSKPKRSRAITHRLLTSQELINEKKARLVKKEKEEVAKWERKEWALQKKWID
ncbi:hypothetical protein PoB_006443700 [Plakobranchus ocellatus]|uniref:Uncharacterized protein n=1 Tax=Plakobranchus ocellatus TaxID=259542 RepID=A0AAV4D1A1_9GAST|nr:hypothetical protein PoB_006443700 [Plakobranchus ocellatus]